MNEVSVSTATIDPWATDALPLSRRHALVVGAGIAGLAGALALRQRGAAVKVLEQATAFDEVGAGLQISPNGVRVLRALGIEPDEFGTRATAVVLHDHRGRVQLRMELPQDPGFYFVHRADLHGALLGAAESAGVDIRSARPVEDIDVTGNTTRLMLTGGGWMTAPGIVIGADGLHSCVRAVMLGEKPPAFTGNIAWRALIPGELMTDGVEVSRIPAPEVHVYMGPGRHLVSYPLRGGRLRNIVAVEERAEWVRESWSQQDDPRHLREAFAGFGGEVPGWLSRVGTVWLWGLFRNPVARHWTDGGGRLALMGDAAHPTLPFLAQGANLALEDAWELASALAAWPSHSATAMRAYAASRRPRARAIVSAANRNALAWHLRAPLAPLAHAMLRLGGTIAPNAALKRFNWVYDYDATAKRFRGR